MDYKIIQKEAFRFVGVSKRVSLQFEGVNNEIVDLVNEITDEQWKELHQLQNMELTHMIGVLTTCVDISDQFNQFSVPPLTWAVFPNEGPFPSTLQDTMASIYAKWLPTSDYELAYSLSFSFTKMDEHQDHYAYSEVWIPVQLKK